MSTLLIYFTIARMQFEKGKHITIANIVDETGLSRSTVNRHMKSLVEYGFMLRVGYGKYVVETSYETEIFGFLTLTPLTYYEFISRAK